MINRPTKLIIRNRTTTKIESKVNDISNDLKKLIRTYPHTMDYLLTNYSIPYYHPFDEYYSACQADELIKKLKEDKKNPKLIRFLPLDSDSLLIPRGYNCNLAWRSHDACICDELIFDIILHRPLKLKDYMDKIFHLTVRATPYSID